MKKYLSNNFDLNQLIDVFDELPLWSAPFGLKLLDAIDYKPNISALDIGFGTGFPLTELAMRLGENSTVYGIDPWKEAIVRANKKIDLYGITNIKIFEGVAESIPLANESIYLIVSNNGINNVNDIDKVFSECSRIIKPGGQFVQTMNLDKSMFEFYGQLENVLSELHLDKEIELMHEHIYQKRRPLHEIVSLLQKQGFIIKDLEHDQFNYKFADGTAMLNHYFIRLAFMESWIKLLPEDKTEQIFDTIETRLNEQARQLGGIKLSIPYVMINAKKKL
ncbi:MAG: class I SAM-dependent methyltransferase [Ignavibacteria bacterium]|nr:class I SAM-dependent methyltransferase [Ignavibacteria bacterium]